MMKSLCIALFLAIVVCICQSEIINKQANSVRCQKASNGRLVCYCGRNQVQFDRSKGERCINEKVVQRSRLSKLAGLRLTTTPIHQSARDSKEIWRCPVLQIKLPVGSTNEQAFVPLRNVSVEAWIDSFAADVTLTQTFVNREENPIEAIYVFPIEENAAVYSFTAQIDDRTVVAQLKEKKEAEKEYQTAIDQGQTAVLLRQSKETLDTFTINVGALPPGKECRITIQYVTELDLVNETSIRFVVPTTIAPRYNPSLGGLQSPERLGAEYVQKTPYSMWFQAHIFRGDQYKIMQVANMSHPVNVNVTNQLIHISSESIALDRDIILDIDLPTNRPLTSVSMEKFNQTSQTAILLAFTPRLSDFMKISEGSESNTEFIFIVDCSGSMDTENRIGLAREAMLLFVRSLPVGANFNIIRFGTNYDILFKNEVLTAVYNENTAKEAERLSRSMKADFGGTELLDPLKYLKDHPPIKGRSRQVFLLTDGEISNTNEVIDLCRSMAATTRVFSFGLGYSSSRSLVKGLARATNGYYVFVPPDSKVDTYVASQFGRALQPSVVNAQLKWHGLSTLVSQAPKQIPPLYVNDRVLIYAVLENEQLNLENVNVDLVVEGEKISSIKLPKKVEYKRDIIRRLAAKALIQELQHQKSSTEDTEDETTREQRITALSLNHQILSPYTAFVGVETTGPRINANESQVRHIPVQISKGDEHLFRPQFAYHAFPPSGVAYGPMPMAMASMHRSGPFKSYGMRGPGGPMVQYAPPPPARFQTTTSQHSYGYGGPIGRHTVADDADAHSDSESLDFANSLLSSDPVRWLIDQQSFNGAWSLTETDIGKLTNGKSLSTFRSTLTNSNEALTTALAIAILESKHSNQNTLWNAVVNKGRKRLSSLGLSDDQMNSLINEIKSKL